MKKLLAALVLIISFSGHAQTVTCFETNPEVDPAVSKFCLENFGSSQSIRVSAFYSGFQATAGFENQVLTIQESHRGYTAQEAPQIVYTPTRLLDGRYLTLSIVCVEEYGIQFIADIQDESINKNIFVTAKGFRGCNNLWGLFP